MTGERHQNDTEKTMPTIAVRVKDELDLAIKEVVRREEDMPTTSDVVRLALSSFIGQYAEAHPDFKDFLYEIARVALDGRLTELRASLGEKALDGLELFPKSQDTAGQG